MASVAGAHSERVALARELRSSKGRKAQGRFAFEGPTLFEEAARSGAQIVEIYATREVYEANALVREMETSGTPVFIVDERVAEKLSDVETPSGLVAIAPQRLVPPNNALATRLCLVLADLNDPGNAGTLLRSAEAFGAQAVIFGSLGVEPYHPKIVRAAMGAIFRLSVSLASPGEVIAAAADSGTLVLGLEAGAEDIARTQRASRTALIIGHERRGLGPWGAACARRVSIPMQGLTESLNAAIAGSIALYCLSGQAETGLH